MTRDWTRLARAIAQARNARGWTQEELADWAGIGYSTLQAIEGGQEFKRVPPSVRAVERTLGWPHGTADTVLQGGDPPTSPPPSTPGLADAALPAGLPLRVLQELKRGQILESEVLDLGDKGGRLIVVATTEHSDGDQLREDVEAWLKVQKRLRGAAGEDASD